MTEASIMKEEDEGAMVESLLRACREGGAPDVEGLLAAYPDLDINTCNEAGETALHVACGAGRLETVTLLLNRGANINALTQAGDSVLHYAARFGYVTVARYLQSQHVDLNARNEVFETPIHLAASNGHEDVLDLLCQTGGDYNMQNVRGSSALHMACERCDISTALRLVNYACRTDIVDQMDDTALHVACREDLLPVVQTMCAYGCPVDFQNRAGMTPLHLAAKCGNADLARCLLLSGADTEKLNKDGNRAEEIALGTGNTEVAELLARISATSALDKRETYVRQLLPSTRQLHSIKVKVFGSSGVGKSTLIESLKTGYLRSLIRMAFSGSKKTLTTPTDDASTPKDRRRRSTYFIAPHAGYTKGINVQQVNIAEAGELSIWEFSGYEPYYLLYDQFMGEPNCINLVVCSMKDEEEVRNRQIKFWLNFIRSRMSPNEPIGFGGSQLVASRVLLIATHADEAQCQRNTKGQFTMNGKAAFVNELLKEFGADLLIGPHFFILDANQPSSPEIKSLRTTLAGMKTFIVQYLPPCLGFLEAAISALPQWIKLVSEYPVVSWPTFIEYVRSKVNLLATEEHVRELTRQLQLVGEIVALKTDDDSDDMLVLSPQWLCADIIGEFLSHDRCLRAPLNGRLTVDHVRAIYPKSDISDVTTLIETLELSSRAAINGDVEYDVPCLNVLECPTKLWETEDAQGGGATDVWGGVEISAMIGMGDQLIHVFPRLQTYLRVRLSRRGAYVIYNWRWGSKVKVGALGAVIELRPENAWAVELKCRGPSDQRSAMFVFQEELCEIVYSVINDCLPGTYLERQPLSVNSLRERRVPCLSYEPRAILLAQLDGRQTVQLAPRPALGITAHPAPEQIVDLVAFGSQEIYACMTPGMHLHISNMMLYARYVLACQLDMTNPLGRDWCMLAILLGLTDQLPKVDINEAAALSKTDAILALWSRSPDATFKALYEKLVQLDRPDAVDAMLALTPLYRYTTPDSASGRTGGADSQPATPVGGKIPKGSPGSPLSKYAIPYSSGSEGSADGSVLHDQAVSVTAPSEPVVSGGGDKRQDVNENRIKNGDGHLEIYLPKMDSNRSDDIEMSEMQSRNVRGKDALHDAPKVAEESFTSKIEQLQSANGSEKPLLHKPPESVNANLTSGFALEDISTKDGEREISQSLQDIRLENLESDPEGLKPLSTIDLDTHEDDILQERIKQRYDEKEVDDMEAVDLQKLSSSKPRLFSRENDDDAYEKEDEGRISQSSLQQESHRESITEEAKVEHDNTKENSSHSIISTDGISSPQNKNLDEDYDEEDDSEKDDDSKRSVAHSHQPADDGDKFDDQHLTQNAAKEDNDHIALMHSKQELETQNLKMREEKDDLQMNSSEHGKELHDKADDEILRHGNNSEEMLSSEEDEEKGDIEIKQTKLGQHDEEEEVESESFI